MSTERFSPRKDPLVEAGCAVPALAAIAFFAYLALDDPRTAEIALRYIAGIVLLVLVVAVLGRTNPYSRAARTYSAKEIARLREQMGQKIEQMHLLSPRDFEIAIGRLFKTQGFDVEVTPATGDVGKDLILRRGGDTILVEVKLYADGRKVGRPAVMKLHSAVVHERANGGIFITTSDFTRQAREFADLNQIRLIERRELGLLLSSAYPGASGGPVYLRAMCPKCAEIVPFPETGIDSKQCPNGHSVSNPIPKSLRSKGPSCRTCNVEMARIRIQGSKYHRYVCPVCRKSPLGP